jgi:hypothetical protein
LVFRAAIVAHGIARIVAAATAVRSARIAASGWAARVAAGQQAVDDPRHARTDDVFHIAQQLAGQAYGPYGDSGDRAAGHAEVAGAAPSAIGIATSIPSISSIPAITVVSGVKIRLADVACPMASTVGAV